MGARPFCPGAPSGRGFVFLDSLVLREILGCPLFLIRRKRTWWPIIGGSEAGIGPGRGWWGYNAFFYHDTSHFDFLVLSFFLERVLGFGKGFACVDGGPLTGATLDRGEHFRIFLGYGTGWGVLDGSL